MFSFDPRLHRAPLQEARDLDIFFCGTLDGTVYEERCRWVHRLTTLAPRYRVLIGNNVRGQEYVDLLGRSRITFNHSLRGEMNMRAYEAPACGTLLFQERDNREIHEVFRDGLHCVLYGEDDLEERLVYYLEHEDERRAVAAAGHERIQQETASRHLDRLVACIRAIASWGPAVRPMSTLSRTEREWRRAMKVLMSGSYWNWAVASSILETIDRGAPHTRVSGSLASILGSLAPRNPDTDERVLMLQTARLHAGRALAAEPDDPMHHLRLGEIEVLEARYPAAASHFAAAAMLARESRGRLDSLPLPYYFGSLRVALDNAATGGPASFDRAARRIVRARALHRLADLCHALGLAREGLEALRESVREVPHVDDNSLVLAQRLVMAGDRPEEALAHLRGLVARYPFSFNARQQLVELLLDQGRLDESNAILDETAHLLSLLYVKDQGPDDPDYLAGRSQRDQLPAPVGLAQA